MMIKCIVKLIVNIIAAGYFIFLIVMILWCLSDDDIGIGNVTFLLFQKMFWNYFMHGLGIICLFCAVYSLILHEETKNKREYVCHPLT
jgi:hypothetical protein